MKPHAVTPTDTRDGETLGFSARVRETAGPKLAADFNAACVRMGSMIARAQDLAARTGKGAQP